jgi:hypothetical protein
MKKEGLRFLEMRNRLGMTALNIVGEVGHDTIIQEVKKLRKYLLQLSRYRWVRRDHVLDYSVDVLTNVIDHFIGAVKQSEPAEMLYWIGKLLSELALTIKTLNNYIERYSKEVKTDVSQDVVE